MKVCLFDTLLKHIIESKVSFDGQKDEIIKSSNVHQLGYWLINQVLLQLQNNELHSLLDSFFTAL